MSDTPLTSPTELISTDDPIHKRSGGICEIDGTNKATTRHLRKTTDDGGTTAPSNSLHLCARCSRRLTDDWPEYFTLGWRVHKKQDLADVPVQINHGRRSGLYLLDDNGDYREAYPDLEEAS